MCIHLLLPRALSSSILSEAARHCCDTGVLRNHVGFGYSNNLVRNFDPLTFVVLCTHRRNVRLATGLAQALLRHIDTCSVW